MTEMNESSKVQKIALEYGLSLKDASAYNVQFIGGRPILIDTLSFEKYPEGKPWVAYRQFCQHFLAPLALMSLVDIRLGQLMRVYIDGVPLDLAARLLPGKTKLSFAMLTHIHMHARSQAKYVDRDIKSVERKLSKQSLTAIVDNLESVIEMLKQLRALQVGLCLDDFGTGYSSLTALYQFPVQTLKVDRSFVRGITPAGDNAEIANTIIGLAHNLRMDVVAEGIETTSQRDRLAAQRCEYGQGYFFSEALTPAAAEALVVRGPRVGEYDPARIVDHRTAARGVEGRGHVAGGAALAAEAGHQQPRVWHFGP